MISRQFVFTCESIAMFKTYLCFTVVSRKPMWLVESILLAFVLKQWLDYLFVANDKSFLFMWVQECTHLTKSIIVITTPISIHHSFLFPVVCRQKRNIEKWSLIFKKSRWINQTSREIVCLLFLFRECFTSVFTHRCLKLFMH